MTVQVPAAQAADVLEGGVEPGISNSVEASFTDAEVDELARYVEIIFTDVLVENADGELILDEASTIDALGTETGQAVIAAFRKEAASHGRSGGIATRQSYGECVLDYVGFGTLFGTSEGSIVAAINNKDWDRAAREIAKIVGKGALRGGIVGFAASLAAGGAWCAVK